MHTYVHTYAPTYDIIFVPSFIHPCFSEGSVRKAPQSGTPLGWDGCFFLKIDR